MKNKTSIFIFTVIALFLASVYYLYRQNTKPDVTYTVEAPAHRTIVKSIMVTGRIVPQEEVFIKPNISGIVESIYVKEGQYVKEGELLAKIKIVPNVANLNNAKNQLTTAKIALDNQKKSYDRQHTLFKKGVISANEHDLAQTAYKHALQDYNSAVETVEIVETGSSSGLKMSNNTHIRATVSGMVLNVPVKVGNQVIESNNFNEGTTIVSIADINAVIFEGTIDESEVGKVKVNLPIEVTVGAIDDKVFPGRLDYIAPQGIPENGAVKFLIKATLEKGNTFLRAGLSANAKIILQEAENVLSIDESLVQFDRKSNMPYVEVEVGEQQFKRKDVVLGVSDGIYIEIKKGVSASDKIKNFNLL